MKQLQAINNCTPAISFNFNARQPLSTSMNFSQAKVNETLQELKLPCEKFEEFQHCVRNITQGTKCKPFIYDITEATLGHLCKPEFLDLLKREAHCLDQLEGDQQVEKCLEMAKSATNFVKHSGPVEICRESKKGLQCFRDVAKEKQCGAGLVNSLEKLTQNSLKAIFDMSCDDLEQQFLGPPVPLIDVGNKTAKSSKLMSIDNALFSLWNRDLQFPNTFVHSIVCSTVELKKEFFKEIRTDYENSTKF